MRRAPQGGSSCSDNDLSDGDGAFAAALEEIIGAEMPDVVGLGLGSGGGNNVEGGLAPGALASPPNAFAAARSRCRRLVLRGRELPHRLHLRGSATLSM